MEQTKINLEELTKQQPKTEKTRITKQELKVVARKPFIVNSIDPAKDREKEMAVFTAAKKLSEYVFVVTEKSPKKYRWSVISRMQTVSIEIVEFLYMANFEKDQQRLFYQKKAGTSLKILDHLACTCFSLQAISQKQMFNIGKYALEVRKLLSGWAKSDRKKQQT